jgi:gas vesicle protein
MARHDDSAGSAGALLAGITIGALIGAGVALLLAPQAGEETRRDLSRRARELRDEATDRWDDATHRARREVRRRGRQLRERLDEGMDQVREKLERT